LRFSSIDSRAAIQFKGGETEAMKEDESLFFESKAFWHIKLEMEW
jgi:deoxyribodipyrimidine photo-lyase